MLHLLCAWLLASCATYAVIIRQLRSRLYFMPLEMHFAGHNHTLQMMTAPHD